MDCFDHREFCLPDVLHVVDVAKFLGLHEKTVYLYVREGKIRAPGERTASATTSATVSASPTTTVSTTTVTVTATTTPKSGN